MAKVRKYADELEGLVADDLWPLPTYQEMSLPAVTKHLKVLEKAGLITKTREAQWRPCKLNGDAFKDVADWMEQYREFWEESFDRLEAYLKTVTAKKNAKGKKHGRKK